MSQPTRPRKPSRQPAAPSAAMRVEDMVVIAPVDVTDASDLVTTEGPPDAEHTDGSWAPLGPPSSAAHTLWRARAIRYLAIYLLLSVGVLTLRYTTQNTYPQLRDLRHQVADLQTQRDTLDLQVQQLTTGPRVLTWAQTHSMIPYAQARKQSQAFPTLEAPATPMPTTPLEMSTQWK